MSPQPNLLPGAHTLHGSNLSGVAQAREQCIMEQALTCVRGMLSTPRNSCSSGDRMEPKWCAFLGFDLQGHIQRLIMALITASPVLQTFCRLQ